MRRREFIGLVGGAAMWPLAARSQPSTIPTIGVLESESDQIFVPGLQKGLRQSGFIEGQNIAIEYRSADGHNERLGALAADLVNRKVAVLVAGGTPATAAAKAVTTTTPIVFNTGADPVSAGFVTSFNRPGGNLTGITILLAQVIPKLFELLRAALPTSSNIAFLYNPTNRPLAEPITRDAEATARSLGFVLQIIGASTESGIDGVFTKLAQHRPDGLVIGPDIFFTNRTDRLAALTVRHRLPAIYHYRGFAMAGGLMSYGTDLAEAYRQQGIYIGRVLKGEKPTELPVQQVTKVELVLNLKTAKALGLNLPLPLLGRADEVIE